MQRVLEGLLAKGVPIVDLARIYEALTLRAKASTDPEGLVEAARSALGAAIAEKVSSEGGVRTLTLEPVTEQLLRESVRPGDSGTMLALPPDQAEKLLESVRAEVTKAEASGRDVALVCSPAIRLALRRLTALAVPRLPVLSYGEVSQTSLRIETVGVVGVRHALAT